MARTRRLVRVEIEPGGDERFPGVAQQGDELPQAVISGVPCEAFSLHGPSRARVWASGQWRAKGHTRQVASPLPTLPA